VSAADLAAELAADTAHNRWGLPGTYVGPDGRRLVDLPDATAALAGLLDDQRELVIEGSETATIQNRARYRVADLAAYLLAEHLGVPFDAAADRAGRDEQIAELRERLG
jgi:hypothetical protein